MGKGVFRNEPCQCGSGKKYKHCCFPKDVGIEPRITRYLVDYEDVSRSARIKQCINPNRDECSGKISRCHAIQNNRVLTKLAVDGKVITMDNTHALMFQASDLKGRRIATTFNGFCSYHDKTLFQEIEDREFAVEQKQVFLYSYRTFAWHYHKKMEQIAKARLQRDIALKHSLPGALDPDGPGAQFLAALNLGHQDNSQRLLLFNKYLVQKRYNRIAHRIWKIPFEIQIAVSAMLEIEYDFDGKLINDLSSPKPLKSIYLNIFPANDVSYCMWSWFKEDNEYDDYTRVFFELSAENKANYLNNKLPLWTDALVISPRLWERWGHETQQALMAHANMDFLFRALRAEENDFEFEYMDTPWDFFER